jgi:hypothetical protein
MGNISLIYGWNDWRDILLNTFENRLSVMRQKGYMIEPARKTFIALILQTNGLKTTDADIIPELFRIISEREKNDSRYDKLAMAGHRIGMIENGADLKQYLRDIRELLKPEGQFLLTSISRQQGQQPYQGQNKTVMMENGEPLQRENLIGPYFSMFHFKPETLKKQAAGENWQCTVIHLQDDDNYLARLSLSESESY